MCTLSEPAVPSSTAQALAMVRAGLGYLSGCDAASLGTSAQAEALIGLEQAGAQHTAARARLLAAFSAQQGHHADGQYGPAAWLRAFTHVTGGAAGAAVAWARRLAAHPLIAAALAEGQLSASWAKAVCQWTDQLPGEPPRGRGRDPAGRRRRRRGAGGSGRFGAADDRAVPQHPRPGPGPVR